MLFSETGSLVTASSSRESGANLSEPIEVHTLTKGWTGTRLIREWQGRTYEVVVLDDGFGWQGFTALRVFHLSNVSAPSRQAPPRARTSITSRHHMLS